MSEMVERVAAALAQRFKQAVERSSGMGFAESGVKLPSDDVWLGYASAAIEAMRSPTKDMIDAVDKAEDDGGYIAAAYEAIEWYNAWPVAIDAALSTPKQKALKA